MLAEFLRGLLLNCKVSLSAFVKVVVIMYVSPSFLREAMVPGLDYALQMVQLVGRWQRRRCIGQLQAMRLMQWSFCWNGKVQRRLNWKPRIWWGTLSLAWAIYFLLNFVNNCRFLPLTHFAATWMASSTDLHCWFCRVDQLHDILCSHMDDQWCHMFSMARRPCTWLPRMAAQRPWNCYYSTEPI